MRIFLFDCLRGRWSEEGGKNQEPRLVCTGRGSLLDAWLERRTPQLVDILLLRIAHSLADFVFHRVFGAVELADAAA